MSTSMLSGCRAQLGAARHSALGGAIGRPIGCVSLVFVEVTSKDSVGFNDFPLELVQSPTFGH